VSVSVALPFAKLETATPTAPRQSPILHAVASALHPAISATAAVNCLPGGGLLLIVGSTSVSGAERPVKSAEISWKGHPGRLLDASSSVARPGRTLVEALV
jgi:hypothetical protein